MEQFQMKIVLEKNYNQPLKNLSKDEEKAIVNYASYLVQNEGFKINKFGALTKDGHIYEIEIDG